MRDGVAGATEVMLGKVKTQTGQIKGNNWSVTVIRMRIEL